MYLMYVTKLKYPEITISIALIEGPFFKWTLDCGKFTTSFLLHPGVGGATKGISELRKLGVKTDASMLGHAFQNVYEQALVGKVIEHPEYQASIKLVKKDMK